MSYFETFGNFQQIWRLNYCFQDDNHDDPMSSHSYTLNADHFCIEVACLFLRLLTWVLLSIFGSKGIILKPQKQLSQPYFQDGDGGRMLVLFCCRVLGKRSSAPFGPSSSPLVVEPGFVCIIFILWYFMQSFPMLWMSCAVWERREIFCCLDRVFSRSSLEHCVSSEFPCLSGASGIIRSVAVGEILRTAGEEARSAVQEEFGLASLGDFERWNSCEGSWSRCIIPCKLKQGELFTQRFWIAILSLPENWRLTRWCTLQGT